jgi:hypothetical protein
MNLRELLIGTCILMTAAMNACSQETMAPTHLAQISLAPSRYGELVERLDSALKASGLSRFAAAPGLSGMALTLAFQPAAMRVSG